jgi:hypothetical protein
MRAIVFLVCFMLLPWQSALSQSMGPGDEHLPPVGPRDPCGLPPGDIAGMLPDPGSPGPFVVSTAHYSLGTESYHPPDFDAGVEEQGFVHFPANLECGPYPIIFMMHGGHTPCYNPDTGSTSDDWPCDDDFTSFPNYRGYDYLGQQLASHGFITVSISANGINANISAGNWNYARAWLFQHHMDLWRDYATVGGPNLGGQFIGHVDLTRVGTLGHSRGGEGAVLQVGINESLGAPYGVGAVFTIGATNSERAVPTGVPLGVLLPYCDGDQDDFPSIAYFDDARYAVPGDPANKHTFLVIGANHDNYNTYWDPDITPVASKDDWVNDFANNDAFCNEMVFGSGRLDHDAQRATAVALASAFFRVYLKKERGFLPFLRGDSSPPPSAMTDYIYMGYLPGDEPESRLDVNRLTEAGNTAVNTLGGTVSHSGLARYALCDPLDPASIEGCLQNYDASPVQYDGRIPHYWEGTPGQLRVAWVRSSGFLENELPPGSRDVSRYRAFQFRAVVDFTDPLNALGQAQDLRVEIEDGAGLVASAVVSDHSPALFYPPSADLPLDADTAIPRAVLNTVRVPLSAFEHVFLTDVRAVRLHFDQTAAGALNLADMAFADEALDLTPGVQCTVSEPALSASGAKLEAVGLDVDASDDKGVPVIDVSVFSDEDDLDSQPSQNSPDAKDIAPSSLRLRGEADKDSDGRVYLIVATATDAGDHVGFGCCTVVVPRNNMVAEAESVAAQAEAAAAQCTSFAAAAEGLAPPPGGFFVVGDGPVIGADQ